MHRACLFLCVYLLTTVSPAQAQLISYWRFDGNATAAIGTSGTLVNSPTTTADRNGVAGGALAFASTTPDLISGTLDGSFVSVAGGGGLNNQADASISMWVLWNGVQADGPNFGLVLGRQSNGFFTNNVISLTGDDDPATANLRWMTAPSTGVTSSGFVGDNVWRHVAVTFGGGTHSLYLDGQLVGSQASGNVLNNDSSIPLTIGGGIGDLDSFFDGSIDDVGVYDDILLAAEVEAVFGLSTNSTLQYDLGESDQLFTLHNAASGSVVVDGRTWFYATGLSSGLGDVVETSGSFSLQLDVSGSGVISPVPEPSAIWLALAAGCGVGLWRITRRRHTAPQPELASPTG